MADPTKPRPVHRHEQAPEKNEVRRWLLGIAVVLLLIIVLQNAQTVDVNILFVSTEAPLIVLLLIAAALGAIIGYVAPIVRRHRKSETPDRRD